MTFSKGDEVRCINSDGSGGELTVGANYTVSATKDYRELGPQVRVNGAAYTLWWREDRFEKVEPEDADDVEPEPLKAGEFVLIWAQMEATTEPDRLWVTVPGTERFNPTANVPVSPDAIVRPYEGQTPPWVESAEAKAISAIKTVLVVDGGMHDDRYTQQTAESLYRAGIRATKDGAS